LRQLAGQRTAPHDPAMITSADLNDVRTLSELGARAFPGERTVEQRGRHLGAGGVFGGIEPAWTA